MKHLILIKVRTADPCVTLKFPFVSMCNKRYISKPENKETDQFLGRLSPPCRSFLFSAFLAEFPSRVWVLTKPANFALAFKFHARGSPRGAPSNIQVGAGGLRRWCKLLVPKLY